MTESVEEISCNNMWVVGLRVFYSTRFNPG